MNDIMNDFNGLTNDSIACGPDHESFWPDNADDKERFQSTSVPQLKEAFALASFCLN